MSQSLRKSDRIGGLLRYGIPEFKMEEQYIDRRIKQMEAGGTKFVTNVNVGTDISYQEIQSDHDAVILAIGSTNWRDLPIPGQILMEFTKLWNSLNQPTECRKEIMRDHPFSALGKDVIIIGGGDTGADCLGTVHRHGAASVKQFEIMPISRGQRSQYALANMAINDAYIICT